MLPSLVIILPFGTANRTVYRYKCRKPVSSVAKMNCRTSGSLVGRKCKISLTWSTYNIHWKFPWFVNILSHTLIQVLLCTVQRICGGSWWWIMLDDNWTSATNWLPSKPLDFRFELLTARKWWRGIKTKSNRSWFRSNSWSHTLVSKRLSYY